MFKYYTKRVVSEFVVSGISVILWYIGVSLISGLTCGV